MKTVTKNRVQTTEEYIADLKTGLAKNPDCGTTHYNLAVALVKQGDWDEAVEEFQAAIESSPTLVEAYVDLGRDLLSTRRPGRLHSV